MQASPLPRAMPLQQLLRGPRRWVAFFAAILVFMVAGGIPFLFPVYSKAIKTSLGGGFDNKALTMLAFSKNLGGSLGFLPSALIYDVAPPWAVLPSVVAMNLLGVVAYLAPYLAASSGRMRAARPAVSSSKLMLMCFSVAVGANSQSFAMTGALVSSVNNFPDHRGPVVTLLLAFSGIGGDILAKFGRASEDGAALLLLLLPCLCFVMLLFTWISIIRVMPASGAAPRSGDIEGRRGVMHFLGVSVFPGACLLLIFHVVDLAVADLPRQVYYATAIFVVVVVIISLLIVAVKQESEEEARARGVVVHGLPLSNNNPPPPSCFWQQCYSILRAVFSVDMLLIFLVTSAIGGSVQTPMDMMDQIGQSLGYNYKHGGTTSKLVSLVSLLDYAGRLVGGFGSDYMVARYKLPRPVALTAAFFLACFGHLLIALGVPNALYLASVIMGFCIGALWTVVFVTISEVFETRHLAALYNLAVLPSAVGSYILNKQLTERLLYDRDMRTTAAAACASVQCFRNSFFILAGVTMVGAVVSGMLAWRVSSPFYNHRTPIGVGVAPVVTEDGGSSSKVEVSVSSTSMKLEEVANSP